MISRQTWQELDKYLNRIYEETPSLVVKENVSNEEMLLASLTKLTEEVWELSSEVLKKTKMVFNKEKLASFSQEDLEEEVIDVLFTLILVAKRSGIINLDEAVKRKIEKNNKRGY